MAEWKKARIGYHWVLTDYGLEFTRVRSKFEKNYVHRDQYAVRVPLSWVEKGYVKESKKYVEKQSEECTEID